MKKEREMTFLYLAISKFIDDAKKIFQTHLQNNISLLPASIANRLQNAYE